MLGVGIDIRVDSDSLDAELLASTDDTASNLSAVSDEDLVEVLRMICERDWDEIFAERGLFGRNMRYIATKSPVNQQKMVICAALCVNSAIHERNPFCGGKAKPHCPAQNYH